MRRYPMPKGVEQRQLRMVFLHKPPGTLAAPILSGKMVRWCSHPAGCPFCRQLRRNAEKRQERMAAAVRN